MIFTIITTFSISQVLAFSNEEPWRVIHEAELNEITTTEHQIPIEGLLDCTVHCENCGDGASLTIKLNILSVQTNVSFFENILGSIACQNLNYLPIVVYMHNAARLLPTTCNLAWTSQYAGTVFSYGLCTGNVIKAFPTYTYDSTLCLEPDPDPNFTSPYGAWDVVDSCTTPGLVSTCTWTMNDVQTAFVTNGYQVEINTCSSEIVPGY